MTFLEKLDYLMARDGLNKHTLSQKCGVPYTTIDAFYKKGYLNAKLSTIQKLCDFFRVSLDYFMRDTYTNPYDAPDSFTADEIQLIDGYRSLSASGKEYMLQTLAMAKNTFGKNNTVPDVANQA